MHFFYDFLTKISLSRGNRHISIWELVFAILSIYRGTTQFESWKIEIPGLGGVSTRVSSNKLASARLEDIKALQPVVASSCEFHRAWTPLFYSHTLLTTELVLDEAYGRTSVHS